MDVIGIDLGATNVRVARIVNDKIVSISTAEIENTASAEDLINQIRMLISEEIESSVTAVGIGVPSVVDVEAGIVYNVQNIPSWKKVPLKKILEKDFNKPVYINNDANCFVLGEKYFGKARGCSSVAGLIIGTGFAAGLIFNNKLYSGPNCGAGEVGMIPYRDSIYEHYCSGQFFEKQKGINGSKLFELALDDDEDAQEIYNEFGTHLGNAIKAVLYAYDPELIVFGGGVRKAYQFFKDAMYKSMSDFAYKNSLNKLTITVSELDQIALLGAAALVLDNKTQN
ncbi:MAG: ROK family protein [Gracilimonas sp.]|uniref:ROK family protein n=1 Tax=Gracilimonas sp. TaxID=1974203 RepID=UPI0019C66B94|nr:ROK family protein [Gracilimonas sp.]MBD3616503.1 ROK family protein [Gracilimonas sp.]